MLARGWNALSAAVKRIVQGELDEVDVLAKAKALKPGSFFVANFGLVGGQVAFVRPDTPKQTAAILNYYDDQPNGRRGGDGEAYFVGAPPVDVQVESVGRAHNGVFKNVLMQQADYIEATQSALSQHVKAGTYSLKELVNKALRAALVKHLFHVDRHSDSLDKALAIFSQSAPNQAGSFSSKLFVMLQVAYFSSLFHWVAEYRKARELFIHASEGMLHDKADDVFHYLRAYGLSDGCNRSSGDLISLSIIELIEEEIRTDLRRLKDEGYDVRNSSADNPFNFTQKEILHGFLSEITKEEFESYLSHPYIRTLPAALFAGEMLDNIVMCGITALAKDKGMLNRLRESLIEMGLFDHSTGLSIKEKIDQDRLKGGLFYRFFLEALRLNSVLKTPDQVLSEMLLLRYGEKPADIDGLSFPGKTMIAVFSVFPRQDERYFKSPGLFDPNRYLNADGSLNRELEAIALDAFTKSKRYCPAKQAAAYEFYVMIGKLVMEFDFELEYEVGEVDPHQVKIKLEEHRGAAMQMAL